MRNLLQQRVQAPRWPASKSKVGYSCATHYADFTSKEVLFFECFAVAEHYLHDIFSSLYDPQLDLVSALCHLTERAIALMCSPEVLAAYRVVISQAERSSVSKLFYEKINAGQQELVDFIASAMQQGNLMPADPVSATLHFRELLESKLFESCALAARPVPSAESNIRKAADRAVTAFPRTYGPSVTNSAESERPC